MHEKLGINIVIRTEKMDGKDVFIVNNEDLSFFYFFSFIETFIKQVSIILLN